MFRNKVEAEVVGIEQRSELTASFDGGRPADQIVSDNGVASGTLNTGIDSSHAPTTYDIDMDLDVGTDMAQELLCLAWL